MIFVTWKKKKKKKSAIGEIAKLANSPTKVEGHETINCRREIIQFTNVWERSNAAYIKFIGASKSTI